MLPLKASLSIHILFLSPPLRNRTFHQLRLLHYPYQCLFFILRQLIVTEFEKRMKKTIMHKELERQVSYQYLMRLEAYKLIKHLIGEKTYEGFRIWW